METPIDYVITHLRDLIASNDITEATEALSVVIALREDMEIQYIPLSQHKEDVIEAYKFAANMSGQVTMKTIQTGVVDTDGFVTAEDYYTRKFTKTEEG